MVVFERQNLAKSSCITAQCYCEAVLIQLLSVLDWLVVRSLSYHPCYYLHKSEGKHTELYPCGHTHTHTRRDELIWRATNTDRVKKDKEMRCRLGQSGALGTCLLQQPRIELYKLPGFSCLFSCKSLNECARLKMRHFQTASVS